MIFCRQNTAFLGVQNKEPKCSIVWNLATIQLTFYFPNKIKINNLVPDGGKFMVKSANMYLPSWGMFLWSLRIVCCGWLYIILIPANREICYKLENKIKSCKHDKIGFGKTVPIHMNSMSYLIGSALRFIYNTGSKTGTE